MRKDHTIKTLAAPSPFAGSQLGEVTDTETYLRNGRFDQDRMLEVLSSWPAATPRIGHNDNAP